MKFRKKPVEVEAEKFTGGVSYDELCVDWPGFCDACAYDRAVNEVVIRTLEGAMRASLNDWTTGSSRASRVSSTPANPTSSSRRMSR
jgi:hypothetical protein